MAPEHILQYCLDNLEGTVLVESWGERGIFYNPEGRLKRGVYVLTVKEKDGDNDKGGVVDMPFDFSAVDQILPHPVYAWMGWVCALNPSEQAFQALKPLIQEGYEYAKEKYRKKKL